MKLFRFFVFSLAVVFVLNLWSRLTSSLLGNVLVLVVIVVVAGAWGWFAARRWTRINDAVGQGYQLGYVLNVKPHGQESELRVDVMATRQLRTFRVWGRISPRRWIVFEGREVYAVARRSDRIWARILPNR